MQDGSALFLHSNATTPGPMNSATLGAARALLRKQTAVGGGYLALQPRVLIVPPELETAAELLLAASGRLVVIGTDENNEANTPAWLSGLTLVVEPRLADDTCYLLADRGQIDTLELGVLAQDNGAPVIEEERGFVRDVWSWKVRHTVGARWLDWRGVVKITIGS